MIIVSAIPAIFRNFVGIADHQLLWCLFTWKEASTYDEFKNESERRFGVDDVVQRDDVGVAQIPKQRRLSDGRERSAFFFLQSNLFQGHDLLSQTETQIARPAH